MKSTAIALVAALAVVAAAGSSVQAQDKAPAAAAKAPAPDKTSQLKALGEYLAGECTTCHSRNAKAAADSSIPPLDDFSGWDIASFTIVMQGFQNGDRTNPAMVSVAKQLDAEQMKALAIYFSSLKPKP